MGRLEILVILFLFHVIICIGFSGVAGGPFVSMLRNNNLDGNHVCEINQPACIRQYNEHSRSYEFVCESPCICYGLVECKLHPGYDITWNLEPSEEDSDGNLPNIQSEEDSDGNLPNIQSEEDSDGNLPYGYSDSNISVEDLYDDESGISNLTGSFEEEEISSDSSQSHHFSPASDSSVVSEEDSDGNLPNTASEYEEESSVDYGYADSDVLVEELDDDESGIDDLTDNFEEVEISSDSSQSHHSSAASDTSDDDLSSNSPVADLHPILQNE